MQAFNKKCVVLYSGGLDSLLACAIMHSMNFEIFPLFVQTPFYKKDTQHLQNQLNLFSLKLNTIRNDMEYIDVIKNPQFGYGKNINPCIDCKIFFYKQAKLFMEKTDASFIVTGEVLGQRPMSQRSYSILRSIEKRANLIDMVLRPLSAKCLPETAMEKEGIVDREKLFCITGRARKEQFELAKHFNITDFESPAGGCLLTDKSISIRIKEILKKEIISKEEIELLSIGRHFKINNNHFIVSRKKDETLLLINRFKDNLPSIRCHQAPGAVGVFVDEPTEQEIDLGGAIIKHYSKKTEYVAYEYNEKDYIFKPKDIDIKTLEQLMIK